MSAVDMWLDGAIAGATATLVSNPFDMMRTRMQLQGELRKKGQYTVIYRNMLQGMYRVWRTEGWRALQKGLGASMLWQVGLNGIRIGLYPSVKSDVSYLCGGREGLGVSVLAGATCGVLGSYASSPLHLIKTRLQSQHRSAVGDHGATLAVASTGEQYTYTGVVDAARTIYRENGLRGLWHGAHIAAQRCMMGSASQLTSYDVVKNYLCQHGGYQASDVRVHVIAATVASMVVVLAMNPLDVVMTRSFNHKISGPRVYSNNLPLATWKIYQVEGVTGLYKGSFALFARTAPHSIVTFMTLEWLRKMRERYTNRSYTSGSMVNKSIGFGRAAAPTVDSGEASSLAAP